MFQLTVCQRTILPDLSIMDYLSNFMYFTYALP